MPWNYRVCINKHCLVTNASSFLQLEIRSHWQWVGSGKAINFRIAYKYPQLECQLRSSYCYPQAWDGAKWVVQPVLVKMKHSLIEILQCYRKWERWNVNIGCGVEKELERNCSDGRVCLLAYSLRASIVGPWVYSALDYLGWRNGAKRAIQPAARKIFIVFDIESLKVSWPVILVRRARFDWSRGVKQANVRHLNLIWFNPYPVNHFTTLESIMSDAGCIDEVVNMRTQSNHGRGSTEKFNNSDPSTSTPIPIPTPSVPPPRSTFKSIVLVLTVTFLTIINVGCLAAVAQHTPFSKLIIIGGEYFNHYNSPTNDSERIGLGRSTGPVDRIRFLFEFGG